MENIHILLQGYYYLRSRYDEAKNKHYTIIHDVERQ